MSWSWRVVYAKSGGQVNIVDVTEDAEVGQIPVLDVGVAFSVEHFFYELAFFELERCEGFVALVSELAKTWFHEVVGSLFVEYVDVGASGRFSLNVVVVAVADVAPEVVVWHGLDVCVAVHAAINLAVCGVAGEFFHSRLAIAALACMMASSRWVRASDCSRESGVSSTMV